MFWTNYNNTNETKSQYKNQLFEHNQLTKGKI